MAEVKTMAAAMISTARTMAFWPIMNSPLLFHEMSIECHLSRAWQELSSSKARDVPAVSASFNLATV